MTFEALKETFKAKGQAQYIDYLNNITRRGYWTLSTNHLAPNNPALRFGVPGKSAYSIQDYPPPIGRVVSVLLGGGGRGGGRE